MKCEKCGYEMRYLGKNHLEEQVWMCDTLICTEYRKRIKIWWTSNPSKWHRKEA